MPKPYHYSMNHPRRCELCERIFEYKSDPKTAGKDAAWRCPSCRANPKPATDTISWGARSTGARKFLK